MASNQTPEGATAMSTPQTETKADANATETPTCGFLVPQGTEEGGKKVTKPCVKAPGHEAPHAVRAYSKVDTSVVKLDALSSNLETVPTGDKVEGLTERTRDDVQKKVDEIVLAAHKLWVEAKRPSGFNEAIAKGAGQRFFIQPEEAAAYRSLLRRAASLHTAEGTPMHVRIIPPKRHQDGRTMLYWIAVDKRENAKKDDKASPPAGQSVSTGATPDAPTDAPSEPQSDAPTDTLKLSAAEAARQLAGRSAKK